MFMKKEVICMSLISLIFFSPFGVLVHTTPLNAAISTRWTIEELYGGRSSAATVSVGQSYYGSVGTTLKYLILQVADAIACLKTSTPTKTLTPTQLTISTMPSIVTVWQTFTISGRLTNATSGAPIAGEIIQLQKNVNGVWTDVSGKKNTTSVGGSYSISVSEETVGIYEYRTNYTGHATYACNHSASVFVTVKPPTQLTAAANPATVAIGQTFTIYGSLTATNRAPISGETIQLQKNVNGVWTDVSGEENTTSARGSYSISVSEGTAGIYEYRTNFTGNITYAGNHSASVFVTVQQPTQLIPTQLTAAANPATVDSGWYFNISGVLTNATSGAPITGEIIQLQKKLGGEWIDISGRKTPTAADGSYSITYSEGAYGSHEFRTLYAGSDTYAASNSTNVTVTVQSIAPTKTKTQLSLVASPTTVNNITEKITFTGILSPAPPEIPGQTLPDQTIWLQKNVSGVWINIAHNITDASGSVSFVRTEVFKGIYHYRLYYAGNEIFEASKSNDVTIVSTVGFSALASPWSTCCHYYHLEVYPAPAVEVVDAIQIGQID